MHDDLLAELNQLQAKIAASGRRDYKRLSAIQEKILIQTHEVNRRLLARCEQLEQANSALTHGLWGRALADREYHC